MSNIIGLDGTQASKQCDTIEEFITMRREKLKEGLDALNVLEGMVKSSKVNVDQLLQTFHKVQQPM